MLIAIAVLVGVAATLGLPARDYAADCAATVADLTSRYEATAEAAKRLIEEVKGMSSLNSVDRASALTISDVANISGVPADDTPEMPGLVVATDGSWGPPAAPPIVPIPSDRSESRAQAATTSPPAFRDTLANQATSQRQQRAATAGQAPNSPVIANPERAILAEDAGGAETAAGAESTRGRSVEVMTAGSEQCTTNRLGTQ